MDVIYYRVNMVGIFCTVAVLLLLSESTYAAKYCCYPPQWESTNFLRQGGILANGTVNSITGEEMVSVDTDVLMVNSMSSITNQDGKTYTIRIIQDFKNGKQYQIMGSTCTPSTLGPYTNKCVPDSANYLTTDTYGVGSNQAAIDIYSAVNGNVTIYLDIAKPDCTPMKVTAYGATSQGTGVSSKTYTNFTLGIKDRSVFDIPPNCQKIDTMGAHSQVHSGPWHGMF